MIRVAIIYHSVSGNTKAMAELIREGATGVDGVEARTMPVEEVDVDWVNSAHAVLVGTPTYYGSCSAKIKEFLDTCKADLTGKLGGTFASMRWPGGGGAELAEMVIVAAMLVRSMLVYSSGTRHGQPYIHFGATSVQAPEDGLYRERCLAMGQRMAAKAVELFAR